MSESAGRPQHCPFCGGEQVHEDVVPNTQGNRRFMCCTTCLARGPWSRIDKNAQERWDTRAPSPAGPDALAEEIGPDSIYFEAHQDMKLEDVLSDLALEVEYHRKHGFPQTVARLGNAISFLRSRPAQDRDAERYRWLRYKNPDPYMQITDHYEAAIDASMSQQERPDTSSADTGEQSIPDYLKKPLEWP